MKNKPASQSAFFNPRVLIGMLFLAGLLLGLLAFDAFPGASARAQGSKQNQKSGPLHKVSVSDPQLIQTLKSRGARVIADYGSFVLLEVNGVARNGTGQALIRRGKTDAEGQGRVALYRGTVSLL